MSDTGISESNTASAYTRLRRLIFSGELGAGTDHLESELATLLGMSRTPVREALLRLEAQGLIEVRPRKGVRIKMISQSDLAEIYDILTELESLAAANAAARKLPEAAFTTIKNAAADMEMALAINDREVWAKADDIFHHELMCLGNNQRALGIVEMISDQVRRARLVTLYMRPTPADSNLDHMKLIDAIQRGLPDVARELHRQHRKKVKALLLDLLERNRLKAL